MTSPLLLRARILRFSGTAATHGEQTLRPDVSDRYKPAVVPDIFLLLRFLYFIMLGDQSSNAPVDKWKVLLTLKVSFL